MFFFSLVQELEKNFQMKTFEKFIVSIAFICSRIKSLSYLLHQLSFDTIKELSQSYEFSIRHSIMRICFHKNFIVTTKKKNSKIQRKKKKLHNNYCVYGVLNERNRGIGRKPENIKSHIPCSLCHSG